MAEHNIFKLVFKSKFSISKETIAHVSKELSDEIKYISTNIIPKARGRELKSALKSIETLRERRKELDKKYEDWSKNYDADRMPRPVREIRQEVTEDTEEKDYGFETGRISYGGIAKSVSIGRKQMLKSLYRQAWGTTLGLSDNDVDKMMDEEVDAAIKSLQAIFIQ